MTELTQDTPATATPNSDLWAGFKDLVHGAMKENMLQITGAVATTMQRATTTMAQRMRQIDIELRLAAEVLAESITIEDTHNATSKVTRAHRLIEFAQRLQDVAIEANGARSAFLDQLQHGLQEGLTTPQGAHRRPSAPLEVPRPV